MTITVGVPKELKNREYRVGIVPQGVKTLVDTGARVVVEQDCGAAIGFSNKAYRQAGASVVDSGAEVFEQAELIVKIKEPVAEEYGLICDKHTLFTYLHLAPDKPLVDALIQSGATAIAYETVTDAQGLLPLLMPMSAIAGQLAAQVGAYYCQKPQGGRGVLLGSIGGTEPARVLVLGAGVVGINAAKIAMGLGAHVYLVDKNAQALARAQTLLKDHQVVAGLSLINNSEQDIEPLLANAALVIGAVLVPGGRAPVVLTREQIKRMPQGSVLVDVAIDQGGCFETSRPTSHDSPVYVEEGITHYCVTNMPSAAAYTATLAINQVTLPYVKRMIEKGVLPLLKADDNLRAGLNIYKGQVVNAAVAVAQNRHFVNSLSLL